MGSKLRILIAYYSYTSRVERLAESLRGRLSESHDVTVVRILPVRERPYWRWLALSFAPGARVAIQPLPVNLAQYDRICVGFPKWTLSCPPLNRFLSLLHVGAKTELGLFMAYGGFDEDRFFRSMARKAEAHGHVAARLAVKRTRIDSPACEAALDAFCVAVVQGREPAFDLKI